MPQPTLPNLGTTNEKWVRLFGNPDATGRHLISIQGANRYFQGTCGIVSCANVLRLAGRTGTTENEVLNCAKNLKCCVAEHVPDGPYTEAKIKLITANGGTTSDDREKLLKEYGMPSSQVNQLPFDIAKSVKEGRGVIVSVDAGVLWQDSAFYHSLHAVTVISVKTDERGVILGFYVCDSGRKGAFKDKNGNPLNFYDMDHAHYYPLKHFSKALSHNQMNVTDIVIR